MPKLIDLTGQTFNFLTAIERSGSTNSGRARWRCKCSCGKEHFVDGYELKTGGIKSCGCYQPDLKGINKKHGMRNTPEYRVWQGMLTRCRNENADSFKNYGGRNISVCKEWMTNFEAFFDHVGNRPSKKHSIDRIDNDGDYEPGNVKWSTLTEQMNNCRNNKHIEINGQTKTIAEWARAIGISRKVIGERIRRGWPPERAIFEAVHHKKNS